MTKLFYLMGASGVGKDTLIRYACNHLGSQKQFVFAQRYITRPEGYGAENHIALSIEDFDKYRQNRFFALSWDSHGFSYGIDRQTVAQLRHGKNVIMNGSRACLEQASALFRELHPILIQASETRLRNRMLLRDREAKIQISQRIERSRNFQNIVHPKLSVINNDGPIETAGAQLITLLTRNTEVNPLYKPQML